MNRPDSNGPDPRRELLEDARAALLHAQIELDADNRLEDADLERVRRWVDQAAHSVEEAAYEPDAELPWTRVGRPPVPAKPASPHPGVALSRYAGARSGERGQPAPGWGGGTNA